MIGGQLHHVVPPDPGHRERFRYRFECGYKMGFIVVRAALGGDARNKDQRTNPDNGSEMERLDIFGPLLNTEVLDIHAQPSGPLAAESYALTRK